MTKTIFLSAVLLGTGLAGGAAAQSACGSYPGEAAEHICSCTGSETGAVWGSGPYTSDSNICVAARHAGVMGTAGGTVVVFGYPGQDAYAGSAANGVTTADWGQYRASFDFRNPVGASAGAPACGSYPAGAADYTCACTGSETGAVWGSGPYTADSNICVAARHAGVIGQQGGVVNVIGVAGLAAYAGSTANGVTTSNWGSYGTSVIFSRN